MKQLPHEIEMKLTKVEYEHLYDLADKDNNELGRSHFKAKAVECDDSDEDE